MSLDRLAAAERADLADAVERIAFVLRAEGSIENRLAQMAAAAEHLVCACEKAIDALLRSERVEPPC